MCKQDRLVGGMMRCAGAALLVCAALLSGCVSTPQYITTDARRPIGRELIDVPRGYSIKLVARGLTAAEAVWIVSDEGEYKNAIVIAESGADRNSPHIFGWKADGSSFTLYPRSSSLRTIGGLLSHERHIYGPVGGMTVLQNKVYVTCRDAQGYGQVVAFGFDGSSTVIIAGLPAQGDFGITDIAVHPTTNRLWFGVGAATNSGVVGIDNFQIGWVQKHPDFCDRPAVPLKLNGFKFLTRNPNGGLFGGDDNVETAPYQPFGKNGQLRIAEAEMPTAAIYSCAPDGGDRRVEAYGIHYPRGIAFNEFSSPYATDEGMELRGTRPVKNDPDSLLRILSGTWYGWPDYSADLTPITDPKFLEPSLISRTGYPELTNLIDQPESRLISPSSMNRDTLLYGTFQTLSGAAKLAFVPSTSTFNDFRGNALVALSGDRAPFATSGEKLKAPVGYKVVRVDLDSRRVEDFVHNTNDLPASKLNTSPDALERPIDVKFSPDGKAAYILDFGKMEMRGGHEKVTAGTGKLYILEPVPVLPAAP